MDADRPSRSPSRADVPASDGARPDAARAHSEDGAQITSTSGDTTLATPRTEGPAPFTWGHLQAVELIGRGGFGRV
jgi:hypothetical protein